MDLVPAKTKNNSRALAELGLPLAVAKFASKRVHRRRINGKEIVLNSSDYKVIYEMAQAGYSRSTIAEVLRISPSTFSKLLAKDDQCLAALDRGYAGDLQEITNVLRDHAKDGSIHHIKAYLHVTHGIIVGEEQNKAQGLTINVQMPFPVSTGSGEVFDAE